MHYDIKKLENLEREISITVPSDDVNKEIETKLTKLSKTAKISGFRPGKVPMSVIKKRYEKDIRNEVISDVMKSSLQKTFIEAKLDPVTIPQIGSVDDSEENLKFTAIFEVRPDINFNDLSKLELKRTTAEILEDDVESMIDKLRKQSVDWESTDKKAADGMKVEGDFVGTIDGKPFDGGTGNNVPFVIGSNSMLKEFEEGFIGLSINESKDVPVKFPESYHEKSLAGKQASFAITLRKCYSPKLPELNDDFFIKYGVKEGGISAFKDKIKNNLVTELQQREIVLFQEEVLKKFSDAHDIILPQGMVEQEALRLRKMAMDQIRQYGGEPKDEDFPKEQFAGRAQEQVKLTLLVTEYIIRNKLQVDEQKLSEKIALIASTYADPDAVKQWFYSDKEQLDKIRSQLLEELVVEKIAEQSKVEIEKLSYTEIMSK